MTVRECIDHLQKMPADAPVMIWTTHDMMAEADAPELLSAVHIQSDDPHVGKLYESCMGEHCLMCERGVPKQPAVFVP